MKDLYEADIVENPIGYVWDIINTIAGKKSTKATKVRERNGEQINSTDVLLSEWKHYFSDLLNAGISSPAVPPEPAQTDLPIKSDRIALEETEEAIKRLKLGKASGCDSSITAEAIKNGSPYHSFRRPSIRSASVHRL